jgi:hypothetical protein
VDPLIVRRQEPQQRHQQQRGVQRRGLVVLAEHAAVVDRVGADVGVDFVRGLAPGAGQVLILAQRGQPRAAVGGDPAHHLGGGEVLRLAADLPDAPVRLAPPFQRPFHLLPGHLPDPVVEPVA